MNDLIIFGFGFMVTLVVAGAVGLLLWGAANEPEGEFFSQTPASTETGGPSVTSTTLSRQSLEPS